MTSRPRPSYIPAHEAAPSPHLQGHTLKARQAKSRRWRVVLLRAKGEILGQVEAPDAEAAKAAAAVQSELDNVQRNRIIVQELA